MPNRILREGALDSDKLASVSLGAEVMFFRLVLVADDFGRYDGRVSVIRSRCFPVRPSVCEEDVLGWMRELAGAGLVLGYVAAGKPYLLIPNFHQRTRAQKSKFPDPENGELSDVWQSNDGHLPVGASALSPSSPSLASVSVRGQPSSDGQVAGNGQTDARQKNPRGTRMTEEALPGEWRDFCAAQRADLDPQATFERFRDHWRSVPGQRGVKLDWAATWRNWVRSEDRGKRALSPDEVLAQTMARIPD